MDKVLQLKKLKEAWKSASSADKTAIDNEITSLLEQMSDNEIAQVGDFMQKDIQRVSDEVADIKDTINVLELLKPVLPFLSISTLSRTFFGKSSSWFYQRLNGNLIHGKTVKFSVGERKSLKAALLDVARHITDVAVKI